MLRDNLVLIASLKEYPHIYSNLSFSQDKLIINNGSTPISIDLNKIHLKNIFNDNFKNNLSNLTIMDFAKILEIESQKDEVLPTESIEEEKKSNPKIKNFKVIKKMREDGSIIEYPYYIDEYNQIHVLFNYANTNILNEYQKLFISLGGNVTAQDLYNELERKMKNINLKPIYTPLSDELNERVKTEIRSIDQKNQDKRVYANLEQGIYQAGTNIYTFNAGDNGLNQDTINVEDQKTPNTSQEEEATYNDDFSSSPTKIEDPQDLEAQKTADKEINLISEKEYYMLITYSNPEETPEIGLFESFLEDVMLYEEYLSPEIYALLNRYKYNMSNLQANNQANQYEQETINRFQAMLDRIENRKQTLNKNDALIRVKKLEEEYPKAGYTLVNCILLTVLATCLLLAIFFLTQ